MPSADEDEIYTIARDGPDASMPSVPSHHTAPQAGPGGAPPFAPTAAFPGSQPTAGVPTFGAAPQPQAFPSGSYPMAAPPAPGAAGSVLGPSPVDSFGRGARPGGPGAAGAPGAPGAASPFSQPGSGAAPSPFAAPGGGLIIPETPPKSPWRGVIIVLVVAIIVGAGVALLAMNTGALSTGG